MSNWAHLTIELHDLINQLIKLISLIILSDIYIRIPHEYVRIHSWFPSMNGYILQSKTRTKENCRGFPNDIDERFSWKAIDKDLKRR